MKLSAIALGLLGWWWAAGSLPGAWAAAEPVPAAGGAPASPAGDGDQLQFRNHDILNGTLVSAGAKEPLRWRRTDVQDPIRFRLDNVEELRLAPRPPRTPRTPHRQVVELLNGDRLAGDIVALNAQALRLDTWYAGRLEVQRAMIRRIVGCAAQPETVYAGPTGLADWTAGEDSSGAWTYKAGAFYSPPGDSGSLGRDVNLPDRANIEFDLAWPGSLHVQVGLYYGNLNDTDSAGGYMVSLSGDSVELERTMPQRGSKTVGDSVELPKFNTPGKTSVAFRVNKAEKTIALFLDHALVKQWKDADEFAGSGRGLIFASQRRDQIRISHIVVTAWNGRLGDEPAAAAPAGDAVRLANGDRVSGTVRSIARDEAVLATGFAEMKVPLERIALIEFAGPPAGAARPPAGDVRVTFLDGSRCTLTLERMDDRALAGNSEICGRVSTALDACRGVQFHPYESRPQADPAGGRGGTTGGKRPAVAP